MHPHEILEPEFACWNDLDPAGMVACSSGTAALHLALECIGAKRHATITIPDFTMVACPRAAVMAELVIQEFVGCNRNLLMDPTLISMVPDIVMLVHIYGRKIEASEVLKAIGAFPFVVEDLAEAHGIKPHPISSAACWSFYKNKIVHGEEGGAVWFKDPRAAARARQMRSLGFTDDHDFIHVPRGYNYRMSDAHAELILLSLRSADKNLRARKMVEGWYDDVVPVEMKLPPRDVVWVYDLLLPEYADQNTVIKTLRSKGIEARHGFKPMSAQQEFLHIGGRTALTEKMSRRVIYLPVTPEMSRVKVEQIMHEMISLVYKK